MLRVFDGTSSVVVGVLWGVISVGTALARAMFVLVRLYRLVPSSDSNLKVVSLIFCLTLRTSDQCDLCLFFRFKACTSEPFGGMNIRTKSPTFNGSRESFSRHDAAENKIDF